MPLYDYACTLCGRIQEVRHGFDETHQAPCQSCGGALRRVFNAAPVLFKGSGFYVTDSRRPSSSTDGKSKPEPAAEGKSEKAPASEGKGGSKAAEPAA